MAQTKIIDRNTQSHKRSGFTLVEVLIAGLLFATAMAAVARISTTALTNTSQQARRTRIEAAIQDNMQLIHQADSQLNQESLATATEKKAACSDPAGYLKTQLEKRAGLSFVEPPLLTNSSGDKAINRRIQASATTGIASIIYEFEAPEQTIGFEQRVIEMNPHFQSFCLALSPETQIQQQPVDAPTSTPISTPTPAPAPARNPAPVSTSKPTSKPPQAQSQIVKRKKICKRRKRRPWICVCKKGDKRVIRRCR